MNNFFVRDTGFMPEQEKVLIKATARQPSSEILCVQGVAGSGKTTIALSMAFQLGKRNKDRALDQKQSLLFLTYNQSLADACHQALLNKPDLDGVMAPRGELLPGSVNVLTIQELFKLAMPEIAGQTLDDIECIGKISEIAGERGITDLLPSQIFALITTFLRGRKELLWKINDRGQLTKRPIRVADLEGVINQYQRRTGHYRIYRDSLVRIARLLQSTYEDWKDERLDRSDIARSFYERIAFLEQDLVRLMSIKGEEYRRLSHKKIGDQDYQLTRISEWFVDALAHYQQVGLIEQQARKYADLFRRQHINSRDLTEMQNSIIEWIPKYGLRADPLWSNIISRLPNPVMVVDEVQDLSSIECENLISLWFQFSRTHESRMVLLGDLNQQMTPSGFEWDLLVELIEQKMELYRVSNQKPELPTPLDNNYRTTRYIAETIASMLRQVASQSLSPEEARRLLEHSIDPAKTMLGDERLFRMEEDIKEREGEEALIPRLLIGPGEVFEKGLKIYLNRLMEQRGGGQPDDQMLSTVIITEHAQALDKLLENIRQDSPLPAGMIEIIPVLSCKGLEFDRCVLYGLSRAEAGDFTIDLLSKWYTSFTRARIQLLVYLTDEEYNYILQAGWQNTSEVVFLVRDITAEKVANELEHIGMTELDDNLLVEFGERRFMQFLTAPKNDPKKEEYLIQSLENFKKANRPEYRQRRAKQAAEWFRAQNLWEKAADYYALADEVVEEVHSLHMVIEECSQSGDEVNARMLKARVLARIGQLAGDRIQEKAMALVAMGEIEQALKESQGEVDEIRQQVADEVLLRAGHLADEAETLAYASYLSKFGFPDQAASAFLLVGELRQALASASRVGMHTLDRVALKVYQFSNEWIASGRTSDVAQLAGQMYACQQFHYAGELYSRVGDSMQAMNAYIRAREYAFAENRAELLGTPEAFQAMGKAYEQAGREHWSAAYVMFYRSGSRQEVSRMEKRLRDDLKFILLAEAYRKCGEQKSLEDLANELQIKEEHDLSARCWEIAGQWSQACEEWCQAYYYYHQNFERLLGPDSEDRKINPTALNRFLAHLNHNRERYQYKPDNLADDPARYHAPTAESARLVYRVVSRISPNPNWRVDFEALLESARNALKRSNLVPSGGDRFLQMPPTGALDEASTKTYWSYLNDCLELFRKHAHGIAWNQFNSGNEMAGVRMMSNVCHFQKGVDEMLIRLKKREDPEGRRLWVESWSVLEWTDEQVERELRHLHPKYDSELFMYAVDTVYQNNQKRREDLRMSFRRRLGGFKDKEARILLQKYFPDIELPDEPPAFKGRSKGRTGSLFTFVDLVGQFKDRASEFITDEDIRDEFNLFIEKLRDEPDKVDKLEFRWRRACKCLPETAKDELRELMESIQEAVDTNTRSDPNPGDSAGIEALETVRERKDSGRGDSSPARQTSRRRRTRQTDKKTIETFSSAQIRIRDLHKYSLKDAMQELEGDLQDCLGDDGDIRCLIVIHGVGNHLTSKNKQAGVIRDSVRERLKLLVREERQKIFCVVNGENLDQANHDMTAVLTACQDFPTDIRGRWNQGVTVAVFH